MIRAVLIDIGGQQRRIELPEPDGMAFKYAVRAGKHLYIKSHYGDQHDEQGRIHAYVEHGFVELE